VFKNLNIRETFDHLITINSYVYVKNVRYRYMIPV
jgi:hypothetical protein